MQRSQPNTDFVAGMFFVAVGGLAIVVGLGYRFGTPGEMGPGFFPVMLGGLLILLGLAVAARSAIVTSDTLQPIGLRPILVVLGTIVAFGLLVERLGLVPTIAVSLALCSLAGWRTTWREQLVLFLCLATLLPGVFVIALGLPIPLWPGW